MCVKAAKVLSAGCLNKAVSASHSWSLHLFSTCTSMDFSWRSVCRVCSLTQAGKSHNTLPADLFSTVIPQIYITICIFIWTDWRKNIRSSWDTTQHTSGTCSSTFFHWENGKRHRCRGVSFQHIVIFLLTSSRCRWPPSCSFATSPPSSAHTSCSGRKWFTLCYRKSDRRASPLILWH